MVLIDYEHIRFGGTSFWQHLFHLYQAVFLNYSVSADLKTEIILSLFKEKGAKANSKDNCRGITMFPTLTKIYEIVLLDRLEKSANENAYFSNLQFGFQEAVARRVGCFEASFTILESINYMLERGSKLFACFRDVRKAFDTVWIDGLLYKLFKGRVWLAIKDLYTDVKAQVLYEGVLLRKFSVSQGTGQGRIFAPFMYKVYINGLLCELSDHCFSISINALRLSSLSFADDISLLALHLSCVQTFMNICFDYGVRWRYEFNNSRVALSLSVKQNLNMLFL